MQKRLIEKLAENKRRLLKSEIKEKLVPCAERGFTYRFADPAQSRQLLELVLSNSIPANTREVDALGKTEAKQLILKTLSPMLPMMTGTFCCFINTATKLVR
ncbi:putative phage reverse transcriptase or polymerase [Bacillus spizizenii str. W23]|uniref:Putative phage reverse transcriptase or polymerase n=1 Tax=Bacillus spizizenii (strain ATCC 23059 / NRRL B-14472 / W23) TaxID=655816 RepID=E0TXJ4_BACSH|nr:putative phage reverse transcriptase or polymerase [Bacillus spizizenii str. W23]AJW85371.1 reverse transcriptase [Bacillus spizizenii]EFG93753.1 putative phage reverse transcriptase or polymerase [Bacillus spizizenii ATCC 6633 = JCM 2499]KFK78852.1 hypothetical protein DJ97_822 [Bacillus spizizenii]SPU09231.1 phage reverse transcriptase or polymerase [Bacillus spizizenii]